MKYCLILVVLLFNQIAFSQCLSNYGKEFYISFLNTGRLSITSAVNTTGTITNLNTGYSQSFTVTANYFTIVTIPFIESVNVVYNTVTNKSIVVNSNDPVAITSINGVIASSDMAIMLPLENLGTEYIAMAWGRTFISANFNFAPSALIVATQDNTIIEVVPTSELVNGQLINVPFNISLNRGQSYVVASKEDITGTTIKVINGNKPIAVYCGQRASVIPLVFFSADHLFEQALPTTKLGKIFVTPILKGRSKNFIKVTAPQNNTIVKIDGVVASILNQRQVYQLETNNTPQFIETSNPVQVGLFGTSYTYDSVLRNNIGDPTFIFVQPMHQMVKTVFFETPKLDSIKLHKLCVVVQTAFKNTTLLNGVNIGDSFAIVSGNPNYSIAAIDLSIGKYVLTNEDGIIAYSNGYGFRQAYGYSAGSGLNDFFNKTSFECNSISSEDTVTVRVCKGQSIFKINTLQYNSEYSWNFGDGTIPINTDGSAIQQTHSYEKLGNFVVTLSIINCNQVTETRKLKVQVYEPALLFNPMDTVILKGTSIMLNPIVQSGIVDYTWQPNYQISNISIKNPNVNPLVTTKYKLTITDTVGCKSNNDFLVKVYTGLTMPTAFTPNDDNVNDVFKIPMYSYVTLKKFAIYNRWGQLVFSTNDIEKGWDGNFKDKRADVGTYIWVINYLDFYKKEQRNKGVVLLIR